MHSDTKTFMRVHFYSILLPIFLTSIPFILLKLLGGILGIRGAESLIRLTQASYSVMIACFTYAMSIILPTDTIHFVEPALSPPYAGKLQSTAPHGLKQLRARFTSNICKKYDSLSQLPSLTLLSLHIFKRIETGRLDCLRSFRRPSDS